MKGITQKICMLCFVLINSVFVFVFVFNHLCVRFLLQNASSHSYFRFSEKHCSWFVTTDTSPTPIPTFFYSPSPSQLCLPWSLLAPLSVSSSSLSLLPHPPSSPPCIPPPPPPPSLSPPFFPTWIADISAVFALPHGSVSLGGRGKNWNLVSRGQAFVDWPALASVPAPRARSMLGGKRRLPNSPRNAVKNWNSGEGATQ